MIFLSVFGSREFKSFGRIRKLILVFQISCSLLVWAQSSRSNGVIVSQIDNGSATLLRGNRHPLAEAEFDRGVAPPGLSFQRVLLVLKRSPEQEAALRALLK